MTFARSVFAFALLMLVAGILGSRWIASALFGRISVGTPIIVAQAHKTRAPSTATRVPVLPPPTARTVPTAIPATPRPTRPIVNTTQTSLPRPPARRAPRLHRTASRHQLKRHSRVHRPAPNRATSTVVAPTITPAATPTPTTGVVALANYWVGTVRAKRGQTVEIGYVINNGTGRTVHVMLGASIKTTRAVGWLDGALSDPRHDVVAIVPPGTSTHFRFFDVSSRARPGAYDVAWGLRDAATGERDALVTAASVLRVRP